MEDLEHVLVIDHQLEQRAHVEPRRERVDRRRLVLIGDLDQAEFRPEGVLAHELGVDADEIGLRHSGAEIGEGGTVGDQGMDMHLHPIARVARLDKGGL